MAGAIAHGIEDKRIDGLSFKMNLGASYVVDRRSVTYHPQGPNIYKTESGTKLIRILLTWGQLVRHKHLSHDVRRQEQRSTSKEALRSRWSALLL